MKILNPFLFIFFFPVFGFAQSLNGVYTGVLSNDSTTIRQDQSFEMALTEYKGKVYGYAYSTFIVNDTLYYIVKRVKGKVEGDICEVEDDDVIAHNFPQKPEKKVFVTYTLRRNAADSVWKLDGNWKTNLTKKYYAISGKVDAKEEKDLTKSKLYQHLGDLDLQNTLAFNKPKEKAPDKKTTKQNDKTDIAKNKIEPQEKTAQLDQTMSERKTEAFVAKNEISQPEPNIAGKKIEASTKPDVRVPDINKDAIVKNSTSEKQPENNLPQNNSKSENKITAPLNNPSTQNTNTNTVTANTTDKKVENITAVNKPSSVPVNTQANSTTATTNNQPKQDVKKDVAITNNPVNSNNPTEKKLVSVPVGYEPTSTNNNNVTKNPPLDKKPETSVAKQENKVPDQKTNTVSANSKADQNEKKDVAASQKKPDAQFEFQELSKTNRKLKPAATLVDGRITIPSETIFFKSDSISIALYDNGEVDGDSVSVIINDEMFIENQGLKSSAFRKTYYISQADSDSLLVVLFANNLGKYPPNTGLLQVKDGDEVFYVRFKADLNQNAAIVLRRKSKK